MARGGARGKGGKGRQMVGAFAVLLGFLLAGEALHRLIAVPLPAGVIGMLLLVAWLMARGGPRGALATVSQTLARHMALLFVPAAVGVMRQSAVFAQHGAALVLATGVSVVLAIAVAAAVFQAALRFAGPPA